MREDTEAFVACVKLDERVRYYIHTVADDAESIFCQNGKFPAFTTKDSALAVAKDFAVIPDDQEDAVLDFDLVQSLLTAKPKSLQAMECREINACWNWLDEAAKSYPIGQEPFSGSQDETTPLYSKIFRHCYWPSLTSAQPTPCILTANEWSLLELVF